MKVKSDYPGKITYLGEKPKDYWVIGIMVR